MNQEDTHGPEESTGGSLTGTDIQNMVGSLSVDEGRIIMDISCAIISNNHLLSKYRGEIIEGKIVQELRKKGETVNDITIETLTAQKIGYMASILYSGILMGMVQYKTVIEQLAADEANTPSETSAPPGPKLWRPGDA